MEATDRVTVRAIVAERRVYAAKVAEVQVVRAAAVRRGGPIVAAAADNVEASFDVSAITRSRIPDG